MKPVRMVTVAALVVVLSALCPARANAGVLDHFKCYSVVQAAPVNEFVELEDQFDKADGIVEQALVRIAVFFCNPTEKLISPTAPPTPIQNPDGHLKMYLITPPTTSQPVRTVQVSNQFGQQTLTVFQPIILAVPTQKLPHDLPQGLDHFKCYAARGQTLGTVVSLKDQFDRQNVVVKVLGPVVFCNPVQKLHDEELTPIENPEGHLTCYRFTPPSSRIREVRVVNQFGREELVVARARLLCVPSQKLTPPGTNTGG
jgi:hypothetical protein